MSGCLGSGLWFLVRAGGAFGLWSFGRSKLLLVFGLVRGLFLVLLLNA